MEDWKGGVKVEWNDAREWENNGKNGGNNERINKVSYRRNNRFPLPFSPFLFFRWKVKTPIHCQKGHCLHFADRFITRSNMKRYISGVGGRGYKGEWGESGRGYKREWEMWMETWKWMNDGGNGGLFLGFISWWSAEPQPCEMSKWEGEGRRKEGRSVGSPKKTQSLSRR